MQIGGTSLYIPEGRLTPEEWLRQGEITEEEFQHLKQTGIHSVSVDDETPAPLMMERTLERLFQAYNLPPEKVKYLILPYLYYSFPYSHNVFAALRSRFGLTNALCYSLRDLLCSNVLMGLFVGWQMLDCFAEREDTAIIMTVEKSMMPDQRYGGRYFITGDGGAAAYIGSQAQGDTIVAFRSVTDIRTMQQGKMRHGKDDVPDYFYYVNLVKNIRRALSDALVEMEDIQLVIPNNVAIETWTLLSRLLKIGTERFYTQGLVESGHLNNCDLLFNLHHISQTGKLKPGDYYLLLTLGSGGVICCAVCQKGHNAPIAAGSV